MTPDPIAEALQAAAQVDPFVLALVEIARQPHGGLRTVFARLESVADCNGAAHATATFSLVIVDESGGGTSETRRTVVVPFPKPQIPPATLDGIAAARPGESPPPQPDADARWAGQG